MLRIYNWCYMFCLLFLCLNECLSYFFSSTVEWSFPWKELIAKATATALWAVEAWGNLLVTVDTTSTIVTYGEGKNTETACLLVWADNGRCQNDLPCSDRLSATPLEGWRPASSTSFCWCCQISAADFFACFFVWWFSPSSRSSCAYLWSLIQCGSLFSAFPQWFIQCRSSSDNRTARTFTNAVAFLLWLYLFLFFYFRSEGNFSPLELFFFLICSKSSWEIIKVNLLLSWFVFLGFFSKLNFFSL